MCSLADLADLRRQNPKQHELHKTVFLCEINAACCILCIPLSNLRENRPFESHKERAIKTAMKEKGKKEKQGNK